MNIMSTTPQTGQLLLTARDAARALSICEKTLYSLTKTGKIPAVKIGRAVRYDRRDLEKFVECAKNSTENL